MTSNEIRSRFLEFFKKRGHTIIPSASLITTDEKGITNPTLFNTAGMQPLIPYLLGKDHPSGKRLADSQKCLRTIDIDDIGDKTHATFFEMLGNWSLGDYFKKEAINWSYEFLTSKEEGLGLDPKRLYVTVFEGDKNSGKDSESAEIWKSVGLPENRIYFKDASANWWPAVKGKDNWTGPTGPCSEMFYDVTPKGLGDMSPEEYNVADDKRDVVEIWNDVFMEYEKKDGVIISKLEKKNVDTGAGLERLCMVMQGVDNIYDTDLLKPVMNKISQLSGITKFDDKQLKSARIVADHIRSSTFLISDGALPSNTDRGYVLRKLIRRAIRHAGLIGINKSGQISEIVDSIRGVYNGLYKNLDERSEIIKKEILTEENEFRETLKRGLAEFDKIIAHKYEDNKIVDSIKREHISGKVAFDLFQNHGFPLELIIEEAGERHMNVDIKGFTEEFRKHQALSRAGAEQKFKGGLADANDDMVVRYHTTTHLLHQALFDVLGPNVMQKGSNITKERLRFDFAHGAKMTDEEKKRVEDIVNEKINAKLPVNKIVMPFAEAEKTGAKHFFGEKYGDEVSIYFIGNDLQSAYSKEFCGGPHVNNTDELSGPDHSWKFKIQKEEAVAQGVRRIKAVLS
jgi:alanyl-tRNA synthetase